MWSRTGQLVAVAILAVAACAALAGDAGAQVIRRLPPRTVAPAPVPRQPGRVWIAPSMSGSSTSSQYISPYLWGPYNSYPSWYTDPYNYGSFYQAPTYPLYNPYVNGYANPYLNRYGRPYRNTSVYNVYLVNPYGVYGGYYP